MQQFKHLYNNNLKTTKKKNKTPTITITLTTNINHMKTFTTFASINQRLQ